jgi:hypothetical protein
LWEVGEKSRAVALEALLRGRMGENRHQRLEEGIQARKRSRRGFRRRNQESGECVRTEAYLLLTQRFRGVPCSRLKTSEPH